MGRNLLLFFFCCLLLSNIPIYNQEEPDYKEMFLESESYFLFEEYREALPLYSKLLNQYPENYNYHYRIGICYLNIAYRKSMSISHLEKAVEHITPDYKEGSFKETNAPLEAYYYLGNAYRINNQLSKAIETYKKFKEILDVEVYNVELVNEQIKATENAIRLEKRPIDYHVENLGERINSRFADVRPIISSDEKALAFVAELQFYDAVFYSEKINGEWTYPRNLIPEFGVDGDVYTTAFSYDGKEMYLYRSDNFIGNLYVSINTNGRWSSLRKLNENINTKYWESHACVTKDGKTLYFSSNRKGGYGGLDIYKSTRLPNGEWGQATNLGPTVNTKYNDDTPFITEDNTLYFSSFGHYSMGGYDIFYSNKLNENRWSVPVNLGYPINTTDDDLFFQPVQNGIYAYYSVFKENNFGRHDIYRYEIFSDQHPRKYEINGLVNIKDKPIPNESFKISLITYPGKDTLEVLYTDKLTGEYKLLAPVGTYKVMIEGKGYETIVEDLLISKKNQNLQLLSEMIEKLEQVPVIPHAVDTVDKIKIAKKYYEVSSDDEIDIKLTLEKDSKLFIEVYVDDNLVNTDEFEITRRRFTYTYKPLPGSNVIHFKLLDKDGNLSIEKVFIYYKPEEIASLEPLDSSLINFYNQLLDLAEGDLKKVLQNLDLESSGIRSRDELITYLVDQAKLNNYTEEDVKQLLRMLTANIELQEFHKKLTILAQGELKKVLENMDLSVLDITTPLELIEYLINESDNYDYTRKDVIKLLLVYSNTDIDNIEMLLHNIVQTAPDSLQQLFIQLKDQDIENVSQLAEELNNLIEQKRISQKELLDILLNLALYHEKSVEEFLEILRKISIDNLKLYLDGINLEKEGIKSIPALIQHLKNQSVEQNYSQKELMAIMAAIAYKGQLEEYLKNLILLAEGELKQVLTEYSLEDNKVISTPGLIIDLKNKAKTGLYSERDVIDLLIKYYDNLSTKDYLNSLMVLANDELKEFLKQINLEAEQITSISELIEYLEQQSQFHTYSLNDLIELLIRSLPDDNLDNFIELLVKLANGKLKRFIKNIDTEKENISSITDLFNYLLFTAQIEEFSEEDIIKLFLRALKNILDPDYQDVKTGKNIGLIMYSILILGFILIVFIIFIWLKKRKEKELDDDNF